jgi:hypothetical protein
MTPTKSLLVDIWQHLSSLILNKMQSHMLYKILNEMNWINKLAKYFAMGCLIRKSIFQHVCNAHCTVIKARIKTGAA